MEPGRWRALLRAWGLASALVAGAAQAGPAAMERAGATLGAMKEAVQTHRDAQFKRPPLEAPARTASARKTAQALIRRRETLARLVPQFEADSRWAADLRRFLERWPDEATIFHELLGDTWGERLATDLTGLWLQARDPREGWKTLFPLFRP